jgi:SAM-dependent methyltransferase
VPTTQSYGRALGDIVRCRDCGHMQLSPLPAVAELDAAYATAESTEYVEEAVGQRATARAALGRIERHVGAGRLLDVGAWTGFLLAEARDRGWAGVGLEPSGFASAYAREELGLDVRTASLGDAAAVPGGFDAVAMGDVIEHLPDPGHALDQVALALRPGGVLWLAAPDAGSRLARLMGRRWWSVLPTHVHYFTRDSLRRLLERRGWRVLEMRTAPKSFTVRYYLGRLAGYSRPLSRALVAVAEACGVADRLWTPDFRDRVEVIAVRPGAVGGTSS